MANDFGAIDLRTKYLADHAIYHIEAGMLTEWESDDLLINEWLGDRPHDLISYAAGECVGLDNLGKLADSAEAASDMWALARLATLAGNVARHRGDSLAAAPAWRRGLDALEKLASEEAPIDQRQLQEALELETLTQLSAIQDPADAVRIPRCMYLLEQEHLDR
eukprot:COSAG02_NODE_4721_length_5052_cov_14.669695_4_plen_164_part_00